MAWNDDQVQAEIALVMYFSGRNLLKGGLQDHVLHGNVAVSRNKGRTVLRFFA